ncbi:MAG: HPr family phosphocarrier protein [Pseudomonadales bacterium]|nr:HPr family phosphocarrier protein [Pseudomonadales bacterium]
MINKSITIQNKLGLHARAASQFVKIAQCYAAEIQVSNHIGSANGKSIMKMMILQAGIGSEIVLNIEGPDEQAAMDALIELVNDKFGED